MLGRWKRRQVLGGLFGIPFGAFGPRPRSDRPASPPATSPLPGNGSFRGTPRTGQPASPPAPSAELNPILFVCDQSMNDPATTTSSSDGEDVSTFGMSSIGCSSCTVDGLDTEFVPEHGITTTSTEGWEEAGEDTGSWSATCG